MDEKSIDPSPLSVQKLWLLKTVGPERIEEFIIMADSAAAAMMTFTKSRITRKDRVEQITPIKGPMYFRREYPVLAGVENVALTEDERSLIRDMLYSAVISTGWLTKKDRPTKRSLRRKLTEADTAAKKSVEVDLLEQMVRLTDEIEGRS